MPKILEQWEVMPHGPLTEIDDGILTVAGTIPMPLGGFPRRMTVVRLNGDRTAIWSAIALEDAEMARIESMGRPAFLIVPNAGHRLDSKIFKQRYPDITVVTAPGAREAVSEAVPVDATTDVLDDPAVKLIVVAGTEEGEVALTVERSGGTTLLTNDIIGHVNHPDGIVQTIMARLMGYGVSAPQVPHMVRHLWIKDGPALAAQLRDWATIPGLKRIIVSHGEPIADDPAGALREVADSLD